MESYLNQFFNQFSNPSNSELEGISNKFKKRQFKAKEIIVNYEDFTDKLYLIESGCIRKYKIIDGNPVTFFIAIENQFAVEYISFMTETKSETILKTVEDCVVYEISKSNLEKLYLEIPFVNVIMRKLLEKLLVDVHTKLNDFIQFSPEERFKRFEKNNRDLIQRIPQHVIASYLGVSATSLSRIKKRLINK